MTAYEEYGNDTWWEIQYYSDYYKKWLVAVTETFDTEDEALYRLKHDVSLNKAFTYRTYKVRGIAP